MPKTKKTKKTKKVSSLEKDFYDLLLSLGLVAKKQYRIGNYPVDFYFPAHKLSIQVDGCFHHGCKNCYSEQKELYPRQRFQSRRDKACNLFHSFNKQSLIRFKECYIEANIEKIPEILYNAFNKIKSGEIIFEEYIDD